MSDATEQFNITWLDAGRTAQMPPNPEWPQGLHLDMSDASKPRCSFVLTYPAPRCGTWLVTCKTCGLNMAISAAGRVDDPRRVVVNCKPQAA